MPGAPVGADGGAEDAGVYGPKRRRRAFACTGAALAALIVLVLMF
jgi:hypothetical protein